MEITDKIYASVAMVFIAGWFILMMGVPYVLYYATMPESIVTHMLFNILIVLFINLGIYFFVLSHAIIEQELGEQKETN